MADEVNITIKTTDKSGRVLANLSKRTSKLRGAFSRLKSAGGEMARAFGRIRWAIGGVVRAFIRIGQTIGGVLRAFGRIKRAIGGLIGRLGRLRSTILGVAGALSGILMVGIGAVVGVIFTLTSAFGAMRGAMEGSEDATSGAGGSAKDTAEKMDDLADGVAHAADVTEKATTKIRGIFGAFGQVGAGFIQEQGKILDQTAKQAEEAVRKATKAAKAAKDAADEMEKLGGSTDKATGATTRFGKALDRIGTAFKKAKEQVLRAIAKAITPALEALADLMESPAFRKFVHLLSKDLAKAAKKVADWFENKVIPALTELMEKINEVGGPIEYLKMKFGWLRKKIKLVLSQIMDNWKKKWEAAEAKVKTVLELIAANIELSLLTAFDVIKEAARGTINGIVGFFESGINGIIAGINTLIGLYNKVAGVIGAATIGEIEDVTLPRVGGGGAAEQSTGAGGDIIISVSVPTGTADPYSFGDGVGQSIVTAMRREGLRMPV